MKNINSSTVQLESIFGSLDPNYKFVYLTSVNITVASLFFIFSCYLMIKVKRFFGFRDLSMFLSILSITLSLVTLIVFLSISISAQFSEDAFFNTHTGEDLHTCIGLLLEIFIFYALMIDLYKWCIFIAATSSTQMYEYELILARRKKILMITVLVLALGTFITFIIISYGVMSTSTEN
jgi:hypothetical protein